MAALHSMNMTRTGLAQRAWQTVALALCAVMSWSGVPAEAAEPPAKGAAMEHPFPRAQKAPPLDGGTEWMNTAGPLDLKDLRGKFVILDFWTYCCINCMHILPELKKLEYAYPKNVVVIGVHSAKFDTEKDTENIREAILRYEIEHPVVNDSQHKIWNRFGVNSWPSLRVIDPEGKIVAGHGGELEFKDLDNFLKTALPYYRAKGLLDETPLQFNLEKFRHRAESPLFFPGKILADEPGQRLFIADSNHNRVVVCGLDGKLQTVIGSGALGLQDGDFAKATFNKPQGMALKGDILYVADTENHALRKINLTEQKVETISGTGQQRRENWPGLDAGRRADAAPPEKYVGIPKGMSLNSPWALWIHGDKLYVAMAGPHQIWAMTLDEKEIGPFAGNGREDIVDGPLLPKFPYQEGFSSFAQPSGLSSDGEWLYVADSEGSSVRAVPFDPKKRVRTVTGTAHLEYGRLFEFGDRDGDRISSRLQHCLEVVYHDGLIYVADTYNHKIKVIDLKKNTVTTLAGTGKSGLKDAPAEFHEPAGLAYAAGKLYVADTNNHEIRVIDLAKKNAVSTLKIAGLKPPQLEESTAVAGLDAVAATKVAETAVQTVDNAVVLQVTLTLPEKFKINPLAPMRYRVEAEGDAAGLDLAGFAKPVKLDAPTTTFEIRVPVTQATGDAQLKVSMNYYYCREGAEGLCKVTSANWLVPVKWSNAAGAKSLPLANTAP